MKTNLVINSNISQAINTRNRNTSITRMNKYERAKFNNRLKICFIFITFIRNKRINNIIINILNNIINIIYNLYYN